MRPIGFLICALLAALAGPALANTCRTDAGKTCATGMPVEGYCECGGQGGTVEGGGAAARPAHTQHRQAAPNPQ
jgi:hypothetical protein